MGIVSGIVLFAVIWFLTLFIVLPQRLRTQGEAGEVEPGTPASAPDEAHLVRKFKLVTLISAGLWVLIAGVIVSGVVTVEMIDLFGVMEPGFHDR